jgi:hypothetical protein
MVIEVTAAVDNGELAPALQAGQGSVSETNAAAFVSTSLD